MLGMKKLRMKMPGMKNSGDEIPGANFMGMKCHAPRMEVYNITWKKYVIGIGDFKIDGLKKILELVT